MTRAPVAVVTGLGALSGFGPGAERLFRALEGGASAVRHHPDLEAAGLPAWVSVVPGEDPLAPGDRSCRYALAAAAEAVADAGGVTPGDALAVVVGTTLGGLGAWLPVARGDVPEVPSLVDFGPPTPAHAVARMYGAAGPVVVPSVACASGNAALGVALDLVRGGRARQVLVGGVDALHEFVLAGFGVLKAVDPGPCRPFDARRAGLNLGEGACFLVVEEEGHARARGATIRARLAGHGGAADAHHMTGPDPEGRGAARALVAALVDAEVAPADVDFVSAHGTATVFNDQMEGKALHLALGPAAARVPVDSIKGAIGHTLGAAGLFEALLCVRSLEAGVVVPTVGHEVLDPAIALDVVHGQARRLPIRTALSGSSGFGGTNAAVVFQAR